MPAKSAVRSILCPLSILLLLSALRSTDGQTEIGTYLTFCVFTGSRKSDSHNYIAFIGTRGTSREFDEFDIDNHNDNEVNSRDCYNFFRSWREGYGKLIMVLLKRSSIGDDRDWKVKKVTVEIYDRKSTCTPGIDEATVNEGAVAFICRDGIDPKDLSSAPPFHGSSVLVLMTMCTMPILLNSLL